MASLIISNYSYPSFNWTISDLGNPFNEGYYISAGISLSEVEYESSVVTNSIATVDAPTSSNSTSVTGTATETLTGTYQVYGWAQALNTKYYPAGSATIVTGSSSGDSSGGGTTTSFTWTNTKTSGGSWNTTATEWNALTTFINNKLPNCSFTTVQPGTKFTASIYNEVAGALGLTKVEPGNTCTAKMMNDLEAKANKL